MMLRYGALLAAGTAAVAVSAGSAAGFVCYQYRHSALSAAAPPPQPPPRPTQPGTTFHRNLLSDTDLVLDNVDVTAAGYQPDWDTLDLVNVQIFFRHGVRTPLKKIPNVEEANWDKGKLLHSSSPYLQIPHEVVNSANGDPMEIGGPHEKAYERIKFKGGSHAGQLTVTGQKQMYDIGRRLREEYIQGGSHLLAPHYRREEVHVQSTNINRTLHSLCALLSGLYSDDDNKWRGEVVQIRSRYPDEEFLYPNVTHCAALRAFIKSVYAGRWLDRHIPGYRRDRLQLQRILGVGEEEVVEFEPVRDNLTARQGNGLPLPPGLGPFWVNTATRHATRGIEMLSCGLHVNNDDVLRMSVGRLLHVIKRNMAKALSADGRYYKLHLYSCHDSTLIPMLVALGIHSGQWPPFGADIRVELYSTRYSAQGTSTSAQGTSAQGTSTSAQGTSAQSTSTSAQGTSAQGTSIQGTSAQGTSTQGTSGQGTSAQDCPDCAWVRVKYLGKVHPLGGACEGELCSLDNFLQLLAAYSITEEQYSQLCDRVQPATTSSLGASSTSSGATSTSSGATNTSSGASSTSSGATTPSSGASSVPSGASSTSSGATTPSSGASSTSSGATTPSSGASSVPSGASSTSSGAPPQALGL